MLTSKYLKVDEETQKLLRKKLGVEEDEFEKRLQNLKEWIKQEAHLPDDPDDRVLSNRLLRSNFQTEEAKKLVENYYTYKGMILNDFKNVELFLPSQNIHLVLPLPTLNENLERILIIQIKTKNEFNESCLMPFSKYIMCLTELFTAHDYSSGIRVIQDFDGLSLDHFKSYIGLATSYWRIYQEAFKSKVVGIEYINAPPFLDMLMQAGRHFLSLKTYERITIHKSFDSLHKKVSKEFLPSDYGGNQRSIAEFSELFDQDFKNNMDLFPKVLEMVSREDLRIGDVKPNAQFGVKGTFRALNVD